MKRKHTITEVELRKSARRSVHPQRFGFEKTPDNAKRQKWAPPPFELFGGQLFNGYSKPLHNETIDFSEIDECLNQYNQLLQFTKAGDAHKSMWHIEREMSTAIRKIQKATCRLNETIMDGLLEFDSCIDAHAHWVTQNRPHWYENGNLLTLDYDLLGTFSTNTRSKISAISDIIYDLDSPPLSLSLEQR